MKKNYAFSITELLVVIFVFVVIAFITIPIKIIDINQATTASEWKGVFKDAQYSYKMYLINNDCTLSEEALKTYLSVNFDAKAVQNYQYKYFNGRSINKKSPYWMNKFYPTSKNDLIGIKVTNPGCKGGETCGIIIFDLNGKKKPNRFGKDIFAVTIHPKELSPLGEDVDLDELAQNCSLFGEGVYCSKYYLIGGGKF